MHNTYPTTVLRRGRLALLLLGSACLTCPTLARAQQISSSGSGQAAISGGPGQPLAVETAVRTQAPLVSEVVVTANRRVQTLQAAATSVDVIQGQQAEKLGYNRFEDYLPTISGLGFSQNARGNTAIGIRGMSNLSGNATGIGSSAPTVAVYFNDIPVQGIAAPPDLSLYDLRRIEVLKGPQGTLYGASAMGGAIKLITNAPNLEHFEAKAEAEGAGSDHGHGSYQLQAALDGPIVYDRVGLSVVGSLRQDGGFIDNTVRNKTTGDSVTSSIRGDILVRPIDHFTVDLLAMYQQRKDHGFDNEVLGLGDLKSNVPNSEFSDRKFYLLGLTATYEFPIADITAITSYWRNAGVENYRASGVGYDNYSLYDFGLPGFDQSSPQGFYTDLAQKEFNEEVRLTSRGQGEMHWTIGGIYSVLNLSGQGDDAVPSGLINSQIQANSTALAPEFASVGGTVAGALLTSDNRAYVSNVSSRMESYAGFGNVIFDFTPAISLEVGLRVFQDEFSFTQHDTAYGIFADDFALFLGPLGPNNTFDALDLSAKASDSGAVPKANLSWRVAPHNMVYMQFSQGFRPGGANYVGASSQNYPRLFKSDYSDNYEIGTKNTFFDNHLTINAAAYYIDWNNIQLRVAASPASYLINAGEAHIYGGELSVLWQPGHGLTYGANLGVVQSSLDKVSNTATGAVVGATIPDAPKSTFSTFVQYARSITPTAKAYIRAEVDYRSREAVSLVTTSAPNNSFFVDGYATAKLQGGVETSRLGVYAFIDNLSDGRGQIGKIYSAAIPSLGYAAETELQLIRPRTFGIRLTVQY